MEVTADDMNQILIEYWGKLNGDQKEVVIEYIMHLLEENHPISIDQYNKELDEGIAEIKAGNYYTHEEVVKLLNEI